MDDLARIAAFTRWLEEATSTRTEAWRFGTALFHEGFPDRWDSNFLRVERSVGTTTAAELAAEADRILSAFGHRELVFESDPEGARLAAGLVQLGYASDRLVYLVLRRDPDRDPPSLDAREISLDEIRPLQVETNLVSHGGMTRASAEMLADFSAVMVERVGARFFGARIDGELAGCCELYVHDGIGQIENVDTLERFRNRGVARASLAVAIEAARGSGAELIFLMADDADWPQRLYGKLGFDPVGHFRQFRKAPPARRAAEV
jgi:N-acetylglutamate synthase-like GNAT family acetyltransferase